MNPATLEPVVITEEEDVDSYDVPDKEEFSACDACGHRSYLFYFAFNTLLSYCYHHGNKYEDKLKESGELLADYRETLYGEKRTQGQP